MKVNWKKAGIFIGVIIGVFCLLNLLPLSTPKDFNENSYTFRRLEIKKSTLEELRHGYWIGFQRIDDVLVIVGMKPEKLIIYIYRGRKK